MSSGWRRPRPRGDAAISGSGERSLGCACGRALLHRPRRDCAQRSRVRRRRRSRRSHQSGHGGDNGRRRRCCRDRGRRRQRGNRRYERVDEVRARQLRGLVGFRSRLLRSGWYRGCCRRDVGLCGDDGDGVLFGRRRRRSARRVLGDPGGARRAPVAANSGRAASCDRLVAASCDRGRFRFRLGCRTDPNCPGSPGMGQQRYRADPDGERANGQEDQRASAQPAREKPDREEIAPRRRRLPTVKSGDVLRSDPCSVGRGECHEPSFHVMRGVCTVVNLLRPRRTSNPSLASVSIPHFGRAFLPKADGTDRASFRRRRPLTRHTTVAVANPLPATEKRQANEDPPKCPNSDSRFRSFQPRSNGGGGCGTAAGRSPPVAAPSSTARLSLGRSERGRDFTGAGQLLVRAGSGREGDERSLLPGAATRRPRRGQSHAPLLRPLAPDAVFATRACRARART